jgi:hypothetical protein
MFFPTSAHFDSVEDLWRIPIHGWTFEPGQNSLRQKLGLRLMRKIAKVDKATAETEMFQRRAGMFLVKNNRGRELAIRLQGRTFPVGPSGANGHAYAKLSLTPSEAGLLQPSPDGAPHWLKFQAVLPAADEAGEQVLDGQVQLVPEDGLTVISDIDDTIRDSRVSDRARLLRDSFSREYAPVPGMAEIYQRWRAAGAAFQYVSLTPWQLYEPVADLIRDCGFPAGGIALKFFNLKYSMALDLLNPPDAFKLRTITSMLTAFPRRRFILVGDSGGRDPEIYGRLAQSHAEQILRVYIRNMTGEAADSPRLCEAFGAFPADRWQLFRDANEVVPITADSINEAR